MKKGSHGASWRALWILPGVAALVTGLTGALSLLGISAPPASANASVIHGPLMVLGFVGTLIAVERAVAARVWWAYLAPAGFGIGAVLLTLKDTQTAGAVIQLAGAVALLACYGRIWRRQPANALAIELLGAASAFGATLKFVAGAEPNQIVLWYASFLILTILGERVELARVGFSGELRGNLVLAGATAVLASAAASELWPAAARLYGGFLAVTSALCLVWDVARRTVNAAGQTRFMALAMLAGYGWVIAAGLGWLWFGQLRTGRAYDAILHAVFLGFVISMIMAHASVILPSVIRRDLPYHPVFWLWLVLLHLTLAGRIVLGDAADDPAMVEAFGIGNIVALLGFFLTSGVLLGFPSLVRVARGPEPRESKPGRAASGSHRSRQEHNI